MPKAPSSTMTRNTMILGIVSIVVGLTAAWLVGPEHQRLSAESAGDRDLAAKVRTASDNDNGLRSLIVAEFTSDTMTWASLGSATTDLDGPAPTADTPYEIGSITKTFTGSLFQIAIDEREVRPDDTVEKHVPELAGTPAGGVTLESLAQHRSGLPALPPALAAGSLLTSFTNENPYDTTTTQELERARDATLTEPGRYLYSNLGVTLLGEAVTRAAGASDWTALVRERVLDPMKMTNTVPAPTLDAVPDDAAIGYNYNGLRAPRWTGEAYLPVGSSVFSTTTDVARWGQAMLRETAPGAAAMEPTAQTPHGSIGRTWNISEINDRTITWHNGATAGFRTMLALDREANRGYLVMGNTTRWVDGEALRLASADGDQLPDQPATTGESSLPGWFMYGLGVAFLITALWSAVRGKNRLALVSGVASAVTGLVIAWTSGPWDVVGGTAYAPLLAAAVFTGGFTVIRWRQVPLRPQRWLVLSVASTLLYLLVMAAAFQLF